MTQPDEAEKARPARLSLHEGAEAELDRLVEKLGIERLPFIEQKAVEDMVERLNGDMKFNAQLDYLSREGIDPRAVRIFFLAAAEFGKNQPWNHTDSQHLVVVEGLSVSPLYVAVRGMHEPDAGAAIYRTEEDMQGDDGPDVLTFKLGLVDSRRCVIRTQAKQHRWTLPGIGTVPILLKGGVVPPREDFILGADALEAVTRLQLRSGMAQTRDVTLSSGRKVTVTWAGMPVEENDEDGEHDADGEYDEEAAYDEQAASDEDPQSGEKIEQHEESRRPEIQE